MIDEKPARNFDDVREKAQTYMRSTGTSQAKFSGLVGVSGATLSQFLRSAYYGDVTAVAKAIMEFLKLEVEREAIQDDFQFIETGIAVRIRDALKFAQLTKKIVLITSPPGMGKTKALTEYAYKKSQIIFITARPTMHTHAFVSQMAENVKASIRSNTDQILKRTCEALKDRPRTFVIDEAQHLKIRSIDSLRYIWDMTRIPVLISGNDELLQIIQRDNRMAQFMSRVQHWRIKNKITFQEAQQLIKQRFPKADHGTMKKIYDMSFSTRYLTDLVITLDILCQLNKIPKPEKSMIDQAAEFKFADVA